MTPFYVRCPSSLTRPTLSWFHHLPPNTVTSFHALSKKFVTQYMYSIKRKQRITSLFHIKMGRSESIRYFTKSFKSAILQLEEVSTNTVLQAVKQAIRPNTQSFDSLSLHPSTIVDELFQRSYWYAMLQDDMIATTKRIVASTSDSRPDSRGRGKSSVAVGRVVETNMNHVIHGER